MLYWALIFLLVALVAGALGFGGVAGASAGIAKIFFFVFLILLVVSLIAHVTPWAGALESRGMNVGETNEQRLRLKGFQQAPRIRLP